MPPIYEESQGIWQVSEGEGQVELRKASGRGLFQIDLPKLVLDGLMMSVIVGYLIADGANQAFPPWVFESLVGVGLVLLLRRHFRQPGLVCVRGSAEGLTLTYRKGESRLAPSLIALRTKQMRRRIRQNRSIRLVSFPACAIVADGPDGPIELLWTHDRGLAVESARKLARACGVGLRDETVDGPETLPAEELSSADQPAEATGYFYEGDFSQFSSVPQSLREIVIVGADSVEFRRPRANPKIGAGIVLGAALGTLACLALGWAGQMGALLGFIVGGAGAGFACAAAVFPALLHRTIVARDGLRITDEGAESLSFFPWYAIQDLNFHHTLVEAVINDRPRILMGGVTSDQKGWIEAVFQTISGKALGHVK